MAKDQLVMWRWRLVTPKRTGRILAWRMTEGDAAEWARKNGVEIEKVDGSSEERGDNYGPMGYGPGKGWK